MLHGHGDDGYLYHTTITADFSSNVWYGGLQEGLKQHLAARVAGIDHYPDAAGTRLQGMLEKQEHLSQGMVMVTNGGTEAIYLVAQAFHGATTTIVAPTFAEYADACRLYRHQVQYLLWDKLTPETRFSADLVFLCNPNNPTGQAFDERELETLIRHNKHTLFVLDEAYIHFTRAAASMVPHLHRLPNVLVLRSLTKTCCIPGLRLGYLVAQQPLLERIRAFRMPWSVNSLALEAGYYILENPAVFALPLDALLADTCQLREAIKQMPEYQVYTSHTHYFLLETLTGTAAALKAWLVEEHGILIRDASNFYGLEQGAFPYRLPQYSRQSFTHYRPAKMDPAIKVIVPLLGGYLLDLLLGDPRSWPHPVKLFGHLIGWGTQWLNKGQARFLKGSLLTMVLCSATFGFFYVMQQWLISWPWAYYLFTTVFVFFALANKSLLQEGNEVFNTLQHQGLEAGRKRLSWIVGRDTSGLSPDQIRVAVMESMSENLSDGVIAPLFFYAVLGLPGMMCYKMINTLDSMIGYKNERYLYFGRFAARLDDMANFIPARITALLMVAVTGSRRAWQHILQYGSAHASPNSGYPEAAMAGILHCRFGGPNTYHGQLVHKPYIGHHQRPVTHGEFRKVKYVNHAVTLAAILIIVVAYLL